MSGAYAVAEAAIEIEYEVKKSRFIARAAPAENRQVALALLAQAKLDFPDARHHCWGYLIGPSAAPITMACSDDGEPSGTAGKPILNVLQHKSVGSVMLIVIRYFGGIKLGAGGLVRAYSHAAQLAMEALPVRQYMPLVMLTVNADFALEQSIRHWLGLHEGRLDSVTYEQSVQLELGIPQHKIEDFNGFLAGKNAEIKPL